MADRLALQIAFLQEADKLKGIVRRNLVGDRSRRENAAEHSWHLALTATVLAEYAAEPVDLARVLRTLLIHDLVEIDAGDTFSYGAWEKDQKAAREAKAAERLFAMLPADQAKDLESLWRAFEEGSTPEGRFARVVDSLQPLLLHDLTRGAVWKEHRVRRSQVLARVGLIARDAPRLWPWVVALVERATSEGWLVEA